MPRIARVTDHVEKCSMAYSNQCKKRIVHKEGILRRWSQSKITWAALYYIISITIGYDFFTGTTYANFNIFCLYSFFSSFEQAIARVCTYHRTRESDVDRFGPTLTSDLIILPGSL